MQARRCFQHDEKIGIIRKFQSDWMQVADLRGKELFYLNPGNGSDLFVFR